MDSGLGMGFAGSPSFLAAWSQNQCAAPRLGDVAYALNLFDTHSRLVTIGFHQLIWIVQSSAHPDYDFNARILCLLQDVLVSLSGVRICVLLENQMRNLPCLE